MLMTNSLNFLWIIQTFSLHDAYDVSCPFQSHWKLRAISMCASQRNYSCLFDINLQIDVYRDKCIRPRIVGPGFKYVFQPNPNRDSCDLSRYQPFIFNTTGYSDCVFLKSRCNSEGQITYKNGTTQSDRTCTCLAGKGYTFVKNPENGCFCSPSSDDCSCYMGVTPNNKTIGWKDSKCNQEINILQRRLAGDRFNITQDLKITSFDNYKYNMAYLPSNENRTNAAIYLLILLLSYILVVTIHYILWKCITRRDQDHVVSHKKDHDQKGITDYQPMQHTEYENSFFVRIMIVGKNLTGKSKLLRSILKQNIADVDIIDKRCQIDIEDGKWTIYRDNFQKMDGRERECKATKNRRLSTSSFQEIPSDLMSLVFSFSAGVDEHSNIYAYCGLWDFAGRPEFYANHQTFLTSKAMYLVVADINEDIYNQGVEQCFANCSPDKEFQIVNEQQNNSIELPVIIVFTGADDSTEKYLQQREEELKTGIKRFLKMQRTPYHLRAILFLSNTKDREEKLDQLRQEISITAKQMHTWGKSRQLKWVLFEKLIEAHKEENFISLSKLIEIAKQANINMNTTEVLTFLDFQNATGKLFFDNNMEDFIILNPQWLVEAFGCFIVPDRFDNKLQSLSDWTQFIENGLLSDDLKMHLFTPKWGCKFSNQRENLLKVMDKMGILVKSAQNDFFLMSNKLSTYPIKKVIDMICTQKPNCKRTSWFCLKFEFLPRAFFNHFSAWLIKKYKPSKVSVDNEREQFALFNEICVFDTGQSDSEKLLFATSTDTLAVQFLSFSDKTVFGSKCKRIRKELVICIKATATKYQLKLSYDYHFKCSEGNFHKNTMSYMDLQNARQFECDEHKEHNTDLVLLPWMMNKYEEKQNYSLKKKEAGQEELTIKNDTYIPNLGAEGNINCRGSRLIVTAIDLGTTFSGYAFSFKSDFESNPCKIITNDWSADGVYNPEMKSPSVVLFNPDKSFNSFGYQAEKTYMELMEDDRDKAVKYYYVKDFKMQLHNKEISKGMKIQDETGKELVAITVFTEAIKFLKEHFLTRITCQNSGLTIKDVFFVITVPAIWSDAAKQFMREASEMAGIKHSQMSLAYEPEAAALLCSLLPEDNGIANFLKEEKKVMIVDIGGGTTDITVVKVIKRVGKLTYIEHAFRATGGVLGGHQVNKNFENFLNTLFGNDVMNEFKRDLGSQYIEIMKDFEVQKKTISNSVPPIKVGIRCTVELFDIFKRMNGKDIKEELLEKFKNKVNKKGDKLRFDVEFFKEFFQVCVKDIVNYITEILRKPELTTPSAIILVGGFAEATILREAIVSAFPSIKHVVSPVGASLAVLKGSVIFGHAPTLVNGRVCRETLGITLQRPYVIECKSDKKTFEIDGKIQSNKTFVKIFSKNEFIKLREKRTVTILDLLTDESLLKEPKVIEIYGSPDDNPTYVTDIGCSKRGTLTFKPSEGECLKFSIEIETGVTEMFVRYRGNINEVAIEEKIDFL